MVGLMSGTSADGIDVCIADLALRKSRGRLSLDYRIRHHETRSYPSALRKAILSAATVEDVCRLNFVVAEAFASAANAAISASRIPKRDILAIGSHGQTLFHAPYAKPIAGFSSKSTLQVGDISVIAARTGLTTVGDFRTKDVALGGEGAPLVPFVDWLLTGDKGAVWLNIGGIANITVVPPQALLDKVIAFDTGPGNTLIDRVVRDRSRGRQRFDLNGRLALKGEVDNRLLARMLAYPYFRREAPKSTGPEEFGQPFLRRYKLPASLPDAAATLAALTADAIAGGIIDACKGWTPPRVIATGGGIYNRAIMSRLSERLNAHFGSVPIADTDSLGIPPDALEAFAFAVLGLCTLNRIPANVPTVTGAAKPAVLGKIAHPD